MSNRQKCSVMSRCGQLSPGDFSTSSLDRAKSIDPLRPRWRNRLTTLQNSSEEGESASRLLRPDERQTATPTRFGPYSLSMGAAAARRATSNDEAGRRLSAVPGCHAHLRFYVPDVPSRVLLGGAVPAFFRRRGLKPAGVFSAKFAPGSARAATVCHVASSTIYQSLVEGALVISVPTFHDQEINAERLEAVGFGARLPARRWNARQLMEAAERMQAPARPPLKSPRRWRNNEPQFGRRPLSVFRLGRDDCLSD